MRAFLIDWFEHGLQYRPCSLVAPFLYLSHFLCHFQCTYVLQIALSEVKRLWYTAMNKGRHSPWALYLVSRDANSGPPDGPGTWTSEHGQKLAGVQCLNPGGKRKNRGLRVQGKCVSFLIGYSREYDQSLLLDGKCTEGLKKYFQGNVAQDFLGLFWPAWIGLV